MALKFALFAAVCIAQGFAYQPSPAYRERNACQNPAFEIPYQFEEVSSQMPYEVVHEMDEVRESVSMAALDAYAKGQDVEVVIACFREQKDNFVKLGKHIHEMTRKASEELAGILGDKAEKYAKLLEVPMRTIAVTIRALPEKVYNFIKNQEYGKALEAMKEARKIVEENSRMVGKIMKDMIAEVPEMADRAEELAKEIRNEARKGCETIRQAIHKCIEEGGPKKEFSEE